MRTLLYLLLLFAFTSRLVAQTNQATSAYNGPSHFDQNNTQVSNFNVDTNQVPVLTILDSDDSDYQYVLRNRSTMWDLYLGLCNKGNGQACKVKFTFREITKYKDMNVYSLVGKENVFSRRAHEKVQEVSPRHYIGDVFSAFPRGVWVCSDTSYFILDVRYRSSAGKSYRLRQLFWYVKSTGSFKKYPVASRDKTLNEFLIKNGYKDY